MSNFHTALYRKKRPQSFADIVGQEAIVRTLTNQLAAGHVSHAYLFCGTRGTGKTTTAKIFARAVNCPHVAEHKGPCNTCDLCQGILAERNLNVSEIDAASNNGVDHIRDLREEVKYPPTEGTYKVYIIDEAHMLTTAAFNALLKTLEEPPPHVLFILATTDPQKVPATILSRCQRYNFKRIPAESIAATLARYMDAEGISAETAALQYIAALSDGALRDALSILDQCLCLYEGEGVTLAHVQDLLGAVDQEALFRYAEALHQADCAGALALIGEVAKEGRDLRRFAADLCGHFRNLLVAAQIARPNPDILDYAPETIEKLQRQGKAFPPQALIATIRAFSELQNELRYTHQERMALEVLTVKLFHPAPAEPAAPVAPAAPPSPAPPAPQPVCVSETGSGDASPAGFGAAPQGLDFDLDKSQFSSLTRSMLNRCKAQKEGDVVRILCPDAGTQNELNSRKAEIEATLGEAMVVFEVGPAYNQSEETTDFKDAIRAQINGPVVFE